MKFGPPRIKLGPAKVGYRVSDVERFLAERVRASVKDA
jgi:predicted DNA-binding transcriptional regulator AlpA